MIRGFFPGAWRDVDPGAEVSRDEWLGYPHVIDAQAEVAPEGTGTVIPPGEMPARLCVQPKCIRKAPILNALQRGVLLLAEHDPSLPQSHVMHVSIFGCDIEVATQQYRRSRIVVRVKELTQPLHPRKLERILLRPDRLPVGDINVDDVDSVDVGCDQARLCRLVITGIPAVSSLTGVTREDRDAVVRWLSKELALITARLEIQDGKLVVRDFCFLHAEYVRLDVVKPAHDVRHSHEN